MAAQPRKPDYKIDRQTLRHFLVNILQRDWFHLYSADPMEADRRCMTGRVFGDVEDALNWCQQQADKRRNVYYAVNTPGDRKSKKAKKEALETIHAAHVDVDLPKTMDRGSDAAEDALDAIYDRFTKGGKLKGRPTVIFSGNGVQALWMLAQPLNANKDRLGEIETINKRLAAHFGGDNCHNSDRIMRPPGVWNFPDAKKRERGCTPVMTSLLCEADRDYRLDDFDALPKVAPVTVRSTPRRRDYTSLAYRDWTPYAWADLLEMFPDLPGRLRDTLDGSEHDRSRAVFRLVRHCLDFVAIMDGGSDEDYLDDDDVKKQVAELCWDGAELDDTVDLVMDHIREHDFGRAQLGHTIHKALNDGADHNRAPTPVKVAATAQKAAVHHINKADASTITIGEAELAFSHYMRNHVVRGEMPEADGAGGEFAKRQPVTLANIRACLRMARISARWDAMRNEPRFFVDPDAGTGTTDEERPALMWEIIHSKCGFGLRGQSEIAAIRGTLIRACGIVQRDDLMEALGLLAREDPYHPLEEYCTTVPWDGRDRYADLSDCIVADHPLKRRFIEMFFYQGVGAVKSLAHWQQTGVGLQLGHTLLLIGPQDIGKSTFWNKLVPTGFLSPGRSLRLGSGREADSMRDCLGGLVCVLNELGQSLDRSDNNAVKDFQTAELDTYRTAYARHSLTKPRMTLLCSTANMDFLLRDPTGTRRFLSVIVRQIDQARLNALTVPAELQQMWAQAWHMVMEQGAAWRLDAHERAIVEKQNQAIREVPQEIGELGDYLRGVTDQHGYEWMSATQICKLLGLRYSAPRWPILKDALEQHGLSYRTKVVVGGKSLQRVWGFPVLPERWDELRRLGR